MTTVREKSKLQGRAARRKTIPEALVYERLPDGSPVYYRGYKEYVKGTKTIESIVGSGYQQGFIISCILKHLYINLPQGYLVMTNELGMMTTQKGWRNLDIAIYDKAQLKGVPLEDHYLSVPPKVVIEVDTKADLEDMAITMNYYHQKTDELLNAGVEKVIWVFTANEKIMEAVKDQHWITSGWNRDISISSSVSLNLAQLVSES